MRVRTVYVRFYRAFNFDYLRKHHPEAVPDPWDHYEGQFYPYVKVDLDPQITCVVGANEAGKSQLLDAVEHALGVAEPDASDFCRYSQFFSVDAELRRPHVGLQLVDLTGDDRAALGELLGEGEDRIQESVWVFRESAKSLRVYTSREEDGVDVPIKKATDAFLPKSFRIDPSKPIPDSVPLDYLVKRATGPQPSVRGRYERWSILDPIVENFDGLRELISGGAADVNALTQLLPQPATLHRLGDRELAELQAQFELAFELLVVVGGVAPATFKKLRTALRNENEGFANGLVASVNRQLSESLNLRRWWTQDREFDLQVAARDFDLVFTVRDRTASEYSFAERSSGLKYFLSYLVQYLARLANEEARGLLLMDEPDAFLSNQGQQDLLRLFQDFASRGADDRPSQVVFVTHSPFLIDKNRADRVRVLDKGEQDEGTRVVRDVGRNHFEPLRSAFGSFVGETTFIGNCNVLLEGVADQIYLAGVSAALLRSGTAEAERLDLNQVTLVPAGSASHVPYMAFLARGRDAEQPAVVVLLDGDDAGTDAADQLKRGGPRGKQVIDPKYVLQICADALPGVASQREGGPLELEDFVPISIGLEACSRLVRELDLDSDPLPEPAAVAALLADGRGVHGALQQALEDSGSELRLDKVAFARHVVRTLETVESDDASTALANFRHLFVRLGELQRSAMQDRSRAGVGARVDRAISAFLADHLEKATRSDLKIILETVESLLDSSREAEEIRMRIRVIRTERSLDADLSEDVEDLASVRSELAALRYAGTLASQSVDSRASEPIK